MLKSGLILRTSIDVSVIKEYLIKAQTIKRLEETKNTEEEDDDKSFK